MTVRVVCPVCWTSSPNAGDVGNGYCGRCHAFTGGEVIDDEATPLGRVRLEYADGSRRPVDLQVRPGEPDEQGHATFTAEIPGPLVDDVLAGRATTRLDQLPGLTSLHLTLPTG